MRPLPAFCAVLCAVCCAFAQPRFEVASVKISTAPTNGIGGTVGFRQGSVSVRNITLKHLVEWAYGVEAYRVTGGPSWIDSERYNIDAKPAASAANPEAMLMLQTLLADRFGLRLHRVSQTISGYTLVAEKGDVKLQESTEPGTGFRIMSMGEIRGPGTMNHLARVLKGTLGVPVVDATGLSAKYDINLKWQPDDAAADGEPGASIFAALKEQLGLTLKPGKVPVEVLVIDHAEKVPVEN